MLRLLYYILIVLLEVFLVIALNAVDYRFWVIVTLSMLLYFVGYAEGERGE